MACCTFGEQQPRRWWLRADVLSGEGGTNVSRLKGGQGVCSCQLAPGPSLPPRRTRIEADRQAQRQRLSQLLFLYSPVFFFFGGSTLRSCVPVGVLLSQICRHRISATLNRQQRIRT